MDFDKFYFASAAGQNLIMSSKEDQITELTSVIQVSEFLIDNDMSSSEELEILR